MQGALRGRLTRDMFLRFVRPEIVDLVFRGNVAGIPTGSVRRRWLFCRGGLVVG